jgi:Na+-transporting NADH:ubiquinone oxidoreductase subunit E
MSPATHAAVVFFSAIFTNNLLLTNYLGMCSFLSASREMKTAAGLGAAVAVVMFATTVLNWAVYYLLLVPLHMESYMLLVFMIVIAAFVQVLEMVMQRSSEALYNALGIFMPLITVNCAILGASLFMVIRDYSFAASAAYGAGGGLGWALAIVAMAGIRTRMARSRVPPGMEGAGIALVVAGIMALAFMGFSGVLNAN